MTSRSASTPGASSPIIPSTSPRRARCSTPMAATRPLSDAEQNALPLLARGAALRFLLTRLVDFLNVPPGALVKPKDPLEYVRKLRFQQGVAERATTTASRRRDARRERKASRDGFHRRRLLRKSRPRRLGRDPAIRRRREGTEGRRGPHHQQPHGTDGGDLGAGSAEEAVRRRPHHRQPVCAPGHHRLDPRLEEERLAHRRQEAGEERRSVAAARCRAEAASRCAGTGSRATPATPRTNAPTNWRARAWRWRG